MTTAIPHVTVYGASGHCWSLAVQLAFSASPAPVCDVVAFLDDVKGGRGLNLEDRPILSWDEWRRDCIHLPCLFPVGDGALRRRLVAKVERAGGRSVNLYERPHALPPRVSAGVGALVLGPGGIGANTTIGNHAQILPMHTIGHDVVIGPFVTIAPSCAISGYVTIEEGAFIGVNATILNGRDDRPLVIGAGATVAAGAVVTKSVSAGATVAGNPARPLRELARRRPVQG